ncbi:hypothetical protein UA08_08547 [Talaromyces atroroseus]|uniref:Transcription initiation factor TFIID subunit 10 n=1 Tax=Talaromyces atroroseus TaxID=1441469 RepID=A0A1Q5Q7N4_TALAT|nr:hypothetical protein UA08_08547 [Talaromyces atroroseus]OKL56235.1 hypothetical protein UA08_08547 [Talaromyces atroroseus]
MADSASPSTTQPSAAAGSQLPPSTQQTQPKEGSYSLSDATNQQTTNNPVPSADADNTQLGGDPTDDAVDNDVDMNTAEDMPAVNGTADTTGSAAPENPVAALPSAAAPTKKESSLRDFLGKMDEYAPIIPDAVTAHYLTVAGLPPPGNGPNQTPPHLARLLALATQKFVADIAADAYQYSRIRASNSSSASNPMGGLNAAAGLNMAGAGAAGGAAGAGAGADAGKKGGAANTHLGIQRPGFGGGGQGGSGQGRTVLTMEDLGMAVSEYGVSVKRGEFYR